MSDSHQAIYDAVRSRISNGDVGEAVSRAMREINLSHYADMASEVIKTVAYQYERPSVLFRPALSIDGNKYCALYGSNLMDGCAGFGDTADEAMRDFDRNWVAKKRGAQ